MVAKLNHDWKNINRTDCKLGDPDYYCSGVIAHVFDDDSFSHTSNDYSPWMPNDAGRTSIVYSIHPCIQQDVFIIRPLINI